MGSNETIITFIKYGMLFVLIFLIILTCLCKFCKYTGNIRETSINNRYNISQVELEMYYLESQLRTIDECLDTTNALKKYLDNLHNKNSKTEEDIIIAVGPNGDNIQLGTKITD
jgi:hypothetical protein